MARDGKFHPPIFDYPPFQQYQIKNDLNFYLLFFIVPTFRTTKRAKLTRGQFAINIASQTLLSLCLHYIPYMIDCMTNIIIAVQF